MLSVLHCATSMVEQEGKELFQLWEEERIVRDRFREHGSLLKWEKEELVGLPCMFNINTNYKVLAILADFFCPRQCGIKTPKVGFLRAQAGL